MSLSPGKEQSLSEPTYTATHLPVTIDQPRQINVRTKDFPDEKGERNAASPESLLSSEQMDSRATQPELHPAIIVWWNAPEDEDPENPMTWSARKKWANILSVSMISFLVSLVSSMLAPAVPLIMDDFHTSSRTFATFVVSIFVLGFACGPLLLAPLSELYGRVIIYNVTNVLFVSSNILCAVSRNEAMLLGFRFLSGFAGVATITIGSGTIADIMPREKRGRAVSIWAVGTVVGPMVGPIIGGYVTAGLGWRWLFWSISIAIAIVTIIAFGVLRETYAPVLMEKKADRLRRETGNPNYRSRLASGVSTKNLFIRSIVRPLKMLFFCPIVTFMCVYIAILYGIIYLFFATFPIVFKEVYGFSTSASGLVFIACGIGTLSGLIYLGYFSDRSLKKRASFGVTITPEDRLHFLITIPGALTFPIGIFLYGWGVEEHIHWIVPQIGTALTGFGYILIFTAIQTYLIDAFEVYSASVIGANAVLRGVGGAFLPLSGLELYSALGWGWGNSLLAFVALSFAPLPLILRIHGAKVRKSQFAQVKF